MQLKQNSTAIDQMLRQTRAHHVQLSVLADFKANMLLTISTLLLSFASQFVNDALLAWPARCICVSCVITILFAIYAVMPKIRVNACAATDEEVRKPSFNILFFGDFLRMDWDRYEAECERVFNDTNLTHEAMLRDLYTMGLYLANRKYRYLRYAYVAFASGIASSFIALVLAQLAHGTLHGVH